MFYPGQGGVGFRDWRVDGNASWIHCKAHAHTPPTHSFIPIGKCKVVNPSTCVEGRRKPENVEETSAQTVSRAQGRTGDGEAVRRQRSSENLREIKSGPDCFPPPRLCCALSGVLELRKHSGRWLSWVKEVTFVSEICTHQSFQGVTAERVWSF